MIKSIKTASSNCWMFKPYSNVLWRVKRKTIRSYHRRKLKTILGVAWLAQNTATFNSRLKKSFLAICNLEFAERKRDGPTFVTFVTFVAFIVFLVTQSPSEILDRIRKRLLPTFAVQITLLLLLLLLLSFLFSVWLLGSRRGSTWGWSWQTNLNYFFFNPSYVTCGA